MAEPSAEPSEPKRPPWKNPFVIAFVVGAFFLTVLPFLQRRFLSAPPPLASLPAWQLEQEDGGVVSGESLKGTVWIASFTHDACLPACGPEQKAFGAMEQYLSGKGAPLRLVSFVVGEPDGGFSGGDRGWVRLSGSAAQLEPLLLGGFRATYLPFVAPMRVTPGDAGTTLDDFARLPTLALVDQEGAVRGFWKDDVEGRGNVINAARLLSHYGPNP